MRGVVLAGGSNWIFGRGREVGNQEKKEERSQRR
jgi:hypothetical protein